MLGGGCLETIVIRIEILVIIILIIIGIIIVAMLRTGLGM